jgi:alpha-tubulin suppressor-like RCC1 family protein
MRGTTSFLSLILSSPLFVLGDNGFPSLPPGFHNDLDDVSVSAGYFHTCAIEARPGQDFGGTLKCWGDNKHGQSDPPEGTFVQVSAGFYHTCAVGIDEQVSCNLAWLALVFPSFSRLPPPHLHPQVKCWGNKKHIGHVPKGLFTQVSAGEFHSCGVMKDGSVVCWGANHFNEATPNSGDFVQVSCGSGSTCGLRQNGLVECWGKNDMGQSDPPANKVYKQISSSLNKHVCGIEHENEAVSCWGSNIREQVRDALSILPL